MGFKSFNDWLTEGAHKSTDDEPKFGCVMMDAKIDNWEEFHLDGIDDDDLYLKSGDDSYGKETQPHITILYGIHEEEVDPQRMGDMMEHYMERAILPITEIDIFENEDYDVVKYNIEVTPQLQRYHDLFMKLPNTQTFDKFQPHMTIAYVKPGLGKKYKSTLRDPFKVIFDKAVYSWHPNKDKKKSTDPDKLSRKVVNLKKDTKEKEDGIPTDL